MSEDSFLSCEGFVWVFEMEQESGAFDARFGVSDCSVSECCKALLSAMEGCSISALFSCIKLGLRGCMVVGTLGVDFMPAIDTLEVLIRLISSGCRLFSVSWRSRKLREAGRNHFHLS